MLLTVTITWDYKSYIIPLATNSFLGHQNGQTERCVGSRRCQVWIGARYDTETLECVRRGDLPFPLVRWWFVERFGRKTGKTSWRDLEVSAIVFTLSFTWERGVYALVPHKKDSKRISCGARGYIWTWRWAPASCLECSKCRNCSHVPGVRVQAKATTVLLTDRRHWKRTEQIRGDTNHLPVFHGTKVVVTGNLNFPAPQGAHKQWMDTMKAGLQTSILWTHKKPRDPVPVLIIGKWAPRNLHLSTNISTKAHMMLLPYWIWDQGWKLS